MKISPRTGTQSRPSTNPRVCNAKKVYPNRAAAEEVAARADVTLRAYKCELCHQYHLTSRTKGMKLPSFEVARRRATKQAEKAKKTAPS